MNAPRKKAALKSIEGMSQEDAAYALANDPAKYTPDEQVEILKAAGHTIAEGEPPANSFQVQPAPKAQSKAPEKQGYVYPVWDLWKVESTPIGPKDKDGESTQYRLLAIKILRPGVKLEKHIADNRNRHSHSSLQRYYPAGSITNGHEETV